MELEDLFGRARVLVRLEQDFSGVADSRETFLLAVNQVLRFCPNLAVGLAPSNHELREACERLAVSIYGENHQLQEVLLSEVNGFDAIINVGTEVRSGLPWTTVNSDGWVARVGSAEAGPARLPWASGAFNPIGALIAACLGAGHAFLRLLPYPIPQVSKEISLYDYATGPIGALQPGPELPAGPLELEAFLVGCGAVANGWAYAVKRLPIVGHLNAVDREALGPENLGPYVVSGRKYIRVPKVNLIRDLLAPAICVTPRPEEWELFKIRLRYGLKVPRLIVTGLDNVETRHSVQRLWPECLIDMAAGGTTAQVIVKVAASEGLCLLKALTRPLDEVGYAERLARETGLSRERILNGPTTPITRAHVEESPLERRSELECARQRGELLCGRITAHNLLSGGHLEDFEPAVPFVTCFAGILAAGETVKWLLGHRHEYSLHLQSDCRSNGLRAIQMKCEEECECRGFGATRDSDKDREMPENASLGRPTRDRLEEERSSSC